MKLLPKADQVLGRIADLSKSKGGILLAAPSGKGVTVFVIVDAVGPDVKRCKVGDVVVPAHVNHIWLRGGQNHRVVFPDEVVLVAIEDLPREQFTIEGEEEENGVSPSNVQSSSSEARV